MGIKEVNYLASYPKESLCPKTGFPEFAFIGRSNVGKSSLINMIGGQKDLAKTSKQPGKTQMINYFEVNNQWYLVDLPGYGYAKRSKKTREKWSGMIQDYLIYRATLQCAFILLDSRHPLQEIDREFINWCGEERIPFVIVYTKIDKVPKSKRELHINLIQEELLKEWESLPQQFVTSSENKIGGEDILEFIGDLVNNF